MTSFLRIHHNLLKKIMQNIYSLSPSDTVKTILYFAFICLLLRHEPTHNSSELNKNKLFFFEFENVSVVTMYLCPDSSQAPRHFVKSAGKEGRGI